jgi:hypothetical protein
MASLVRGAWRAQTRPVSRHPATALVALLLGRRRRASRCARPSCAAHHAAYRGSRAGTDARPRVPSQDAEKATKLVADLRAMTRDAAAAAVQKLSAEDAATVLPAIKPGYARAAFNGMTPEQAGATLSVMSSDEIATSLSAMNADEIAGMIKAMTLEQAATVLLAMSSGLAAAALSSKKLQHELSAILLHAMATGSIPDSQSHLHLLSPVAKAAAERDAVLDRAARGRDQMRVARRHDAEQMVQRYRNVVATLEAVHKKEATSLELFLSQQLLAGKRPGASATSSSASASPGAARPPSPATSFSGKASGKASPLAQSGVAALRSATARKSAGAAARFPPRSPASDTLQHAADVAVRTATHERRKRSPQIRHAPLQRPAPSAPAPRIRHGRRPYLRAGAVPQPPMW